MASAPEDARSSGLWAIWRVNPTFLAQPISPTQEAVRSGGCFAPTATTTSGKSCCRWTCRNCPWARRWVGWVEAEAERAQSDSARSNCMDAPGGGARQIIPSQRHPGPASGAQMPTARVLISASGAQDIARVLNSRTTSTAFSRQRVVTVKRHGNPRLLFVGVVCVLFCAFPTRFKRRTQCNYALITRGLTV